MQKLFYHSLLILLTFKKVHVVVLSKICIHTSNRLLIINSFRQEQGKCKYGR